MSDLERNARHIEWLEVVYLECGERLEELEEAYKQRLALIKARRS